MIHISNLVTIKRWTTNILTFIKREMVSWKQSATYIAQKIIGRMDLILDNTRQNKPFTQVCIMMILRCNGLRKIYFLSVTSNVLNCMRYYVVRNLKPFKKTYTILFRCSPSRLSGSVNLITTVVWLFCSLINHWNYILPWLSNCGHTLWFVCNLKHGYTSVCYSIITTIMKFWNHQSNSSVPWLIRTRLQDIKYIS